MTFSPEHRGYRGYMFHCDESWIADLSLHAMLSQRLLGAHIDMENQTIGSARTQRKATQFHMSPLHLTWHTCFGYSRPISCCDSTINPATPRGADDTESLHNFFVVSAVNNGRSIVSVNGSNPMNARPKPGPGISTNVTMVSYVTTSASH